MEKQKNKLIYNMIHNSMTYKDVIITQLKHMEKICNIKVKLTY